MPRRKKPSSTAPMLTRRARLRAVRPDIAVAGSATPSTEQQSATTKTDAPNDATTVTPIPNEIPVNDTATDQLSVQITTENQSLQPQPVHQKVVLHKKFGKYLLMSDEAYAKRFEVSGSDSETNSSIEIRVVDPCASSESDSNAPQDNQSDTASNACAYSPNTITTDSNVSSPALSIKEKDNEILIENNTVFSSNMEPTPEPGDTVDPLPRECEEMQACDKESNSDALENIDNNMSILFEDIPLPADPEVQELLSDDDDVITVVQIMEDDSPDVYYDIKMESPSEQYTSRESPDLPPDPNTVMQINTINSEQIEHFQQHFNNLNLTETDFSRTKSAINLCNQLTELSTHLTCNVADIPSPLGRHPSDILRPDPSPTPSSALSDDSNSSRILSETNFANSNDSSESSPNGVRRSSRIKTISSLKQKTKGYGLVKTPLKKALISQTIIKLEENTSESLDKSSSSTPINGSTCNSPTFPVPTLDMPVKVKSRWRRSSELEMVANSPINSPLASPKMHSRLSALNENSIPLPEEKEDKPETVMSAGESERVIQDRLNQFRDLDENEYLCERAISREAKKMTCDCFLTKEEVERGELGCGEDCLNRLLMIECNYRCPVGERCTNRRFQKRENTALTVFYADKKGCGLEATNDIMAGEFLMEYVGEVLNSEQFYKRAQEYSDDNNLHHYFMSLMGETVIDATMKGNISRFINHSCDPNAETQKWTVNGELRIGFFSKRDIGKSEEITFDYQFQRFGKEAQRCYCGSSNCRGWIGAEPDSDDDEEEEEDDVSTSKAEGLKDGKDDAAQEPGAEQFAATDAKDAAKTSKPKRRPSRPRALRPKSELAQDADIEDDLEALARTGIKNQSHTLTLSRTMVRAKTRKTQTALLRLLREADLPCRRLFLDYRGLRLLAPWCSNSTLDFRLEMVQTLDRLPVPNKTMVQESRLFTTVERWRADASEGAAGAMNDLSLDEATGLPIDIPESGSGGDKIKDSPAVRQKVSDLAKQLLERWSSLKEVFKIPKKERIQQMKEHERQANVERRAADSSGSTGRDRERERYGGREEREKERERHRERERDRDRERERERDRERDERDRRKRRSPDGRRSIRLEERVLAAIPPMSKEERRRAFAEAAAVAEQTRQQNEQQRQKAEQQWGQFQGWPPPDSFPPGMFPPGMMGGPPGMMLPPGMIPGMMGAPPMMGVMGPQPEMPQEWCGPNGEYLGPPPGYCGPMPFGGPPPFCMPQPNFMGMGPMGGGFPMGGFMFPPLPAPVPPGPFPPAPAALAQPPPRLVDPLPQKQVSEARAEGLLPSGWRSATDARGRTYFYHVKLRIPQWVPPTPPPPPSDDEVSSEEDEFSSLDAAIVRGRVKGRLVEGVDGVYEVIKEDSAGSNSLIPERALLNYKPRKRRPGLVSERPISPRSEEDKLAGKMEVKRYRQTKEKLRRRKERLLMQRMRVLEKYKRRLKDKVKMELVDVSDDSSASDLPEEEASPAAPPAAPAPASPPAERSPSPAPEEPEELARRLKEVFRSSMARVMVQHLNYYRRKDATHAMITNTSDFKHLARKLTHFVMLKELKHCRSVEELECNDSVKQKAKEFVRKYMAKFGPVYQRPADEAD